MSLRSASQQPLSMSNALDSSRESNPSRRILVCSGYLYDNMLKHHNSFEFFLGDAGFFPSPSPQYSFNFFQSPVNSLMVSDAGVSPPNTSSLVLTSKLDCVA